MKSTATILAAAMFVGDRTAASPSLAGAAAVLPDYQSQQPVWNQSMHSIVKIC